MSTARKSFLLSLTFHALMGSLAFFTLSKMETPPSSFKVSLKHMIVVTLSAPLSKQPEITEQPTAAPRPPHITPSELIPLQPSIPAKAMIPKPQTVQTTPSITTPVVSTTPLIEHPVQNPIATEILPKTSKPSIDTSTEMQSFKASLRTKIQQNLHYPSAARRRGMEGEVAIRFTLYDDGSIRGVSVQHGEDIFHNAAKAAVDSAEGISIPKNLLSSLPMEMNLVLEFKLNS